MSVYESEIRSRLVHVKLTEHARRAIRDDGYGVDEILGALHDFKITEHYDDARQFPACLLLCRIKRKPIHMVCALPEDARYVNNCHCVYTVRQKLVKIRHKKEKSLGKCPLCGGTTNTEPVDLTESLSGKIVLIKDVKAEVCSQCGERLYSSSEIKKIEDLLHKVKQGTIKPDETKKAEVYLAS